MSTTSTIREEMEQRKQAAREALWPYVAPTTLLARRKWELERIEEIVGNIRDLQRDGNVWVPSFFGGEPISSACDTAYQIRGLTREPVRFNFNGVTITMQESV